MISIVTGGAGFIANTLVDRLLAESRTVIVLDNLKLGSGSNIRRFHASKAFRFHDVDVSDRNALGGVLREIAAMGAIDEVWHLAANSDIPSGVSNPDIDLKDTFLTTFELLRSLKEFPVNRLLFASSSAIYGDHGSIPIHEDIGRIFPISNYGAMKLASEGQISAAVESHLKQGFIFRFPNVVGVPATHGVILDFVRKLIKDPGLLEVLGDGSQQKAYLHVSDLVDAMLLIRNVGKDRLEAYNIGPSDEGVTVRWIAEKVVARMGGTARIQFGQGNKGWTGDVPKFNYSIEKLKALGWTPKLGSEGAVLLAIDQIATQEGF